MSKSAGWRGLIKDVIDISFNVAQVVSPVVSNSSPEGNVPLGECLIIGLTKVRVYLTLVERVL